MTRSLTWPSNYCSWEILKEFAPHISSYLGIGVQEGGCVATVVGANPDVNLVLCDTWGNHHGGTGRGNHQHIEELLLKLGHRGTVTFLDGPSQLLVPTLTEAVDLSYVDGDHAYDAALADLRNAWRLTRVALVCHDMLTNFGSVTKAMLAFLSEAKVPIPMVCRSDTAVLWKS